MRRIALLLDQVILRKFIELRKNNVHLIHYFSDNLNFYILYHTETESLESLMSYNGMT